MFRVIFAAVAAYLVGSVNSSIIISRIVSGKDIRESGSGNAGATNVLRTMGKKYAAITLVIDILKGVAGVLIGKLAMLLGAPDWCPYVTGVCAVLGHNFPVFFGFKGGKGVATSLGVVMMLGWHIGLVVLAAAILVMAVTKYVSLGSIIAAVLFMVLAIINMAVHGGFGIIKLICILMLGFILIGRHHANITRLMNGTENKLTSSKKGV